MRSETANDLVALHCPAGSYPEQWNVEGLRADLGRLFALDLPIEDWIGEQAVDQEIFIERIEAAAKDALEAKTANIPAETWTQIEKSFLLQAIDHHWKEHLATLDALRAVIHLRAYAQKQPINEYKQEAFALFERMLVAIREEVTRMLSHAQFEMAPPPLPRTPPEFLTTHIDPFTGENDSLAADPDLLAETGAAVGRNQPCPCGSGKKYKHCHGAKD